LRNDSAAYPSGDSDAINASGDRSATAAAMNRPTRITFIGFAIVLIIVAWQSLARAQTPDPYQFLTLDCIFSTNIATTLENGKFETVTGDKAFTMTFSGFDRAKSEAMLIGNAGSDRVIYFPGYRKIMLVQVTDTGNGSMTSISEPRNGNSVAFHSRHMWMGGDPVVSHYYNGHCKTRR
jgi:hypothetical protein